VDLDAYIELHRPEWEELDRLLGRTGFGTSRLSAAECDRLLALYQRVGTHLTVIRSQDPDPQLVAWLSQLVARARHRAVRSGARGWSDVGRWFTATLPAALWVMRGWWLSTMAVCTVFTVAAGWYYLQNPQVESSLLSAQQIQQLVEHDFANYYSEFAAGDFALQVWTNNAWIAASCIAFGILGLPVLYILLINCANLALTGSIMINHGAADVFFGLILPHGLLELTAVFIAGGVGFRLFWSWVSPGDLSRGAALAQAGRSSMTVVLGLALILGVSGLIEAFVTPSPLPTWARVGIGILAELSFFGYVWAFGRPAARRGQTGDIADDFGRGAVEITRA
jgi:uncharacterized membrane protein SpoIIM required for sporulation